MIEVVVATRETGDDFWKNTALGRSLPRQKGHQKITYRIWEKNALGLSKVYNLGIDAANSDAILVFIHDDVWLDDYFFFDRIVRGLDNFDVIGVAGSMVLKKNQLSWGFVLSDQKPRWDGDRLSGRVGHGKGYGGEVTDWGLVPAQVALLDGVLMAVKKRTLVQSKVRFDEQFLFHFYDMDFCRSATASGLRLGTWPICITHESQGSFFSESWNKMHALYAKKWPE